MTFKNFTLEIDTDGIALATWDMPDRSMNVITAEVMQELSALIERVAEDPMIKGCVIASGKEAFSGGADLTMIKALGETYARYEKEHGPDEAMRVFFEESRRLSLLFRRLETQGKPFAAAIHGICLGGAFELALACHVRVLCDHPATKVGLPEIKVGIFPGAGGTQRVARLMPTDGALQMLFKGEQIKSAAAKAMGLVHEVVPHDQLIAVAKERVKALDGKGVAPWDRPDFRLPSGKVYSAAGMQIWPAANAILRKETHGNYPAAQALLQSVYEGLQLPIDAGLRVESRYFAKILRSREAVAMIRSLFVSMQDLNKGARRPKDEPAATPQTVGIIGAGFMGASIAYVCALNKLNVVLLDQSLEAAEKGKALSHKLMSDQIMKGRAKTADRDALLERITASDDYARLSSCDLVIEAVFEDPKVKADVLTKAGAAMKPGAILASNTSTLPISDLARHAPDPARFIGIHFFSPVEKMMLVEVIKGRETGDVALATALDFVRAIRKTPIVVNDGRGFYANRCVLNYVREGHLMLMEGVPPAMIENAGRMAGMPVGPLALNDEVAIDLGWRILKATKAADPSLVDPVQEQLLDTLVETHNRLGRKNKKGFYDYPEAGPKHLWHGLKDLQPRHLDPETLDIEELKARLLVVQALEAARTMEEGIVTDPREADVGSILGFGFAPFTGGTLSYIDGMGARAFVALCERLEQTYGPRFRPGEGLKRMAREDEAFYAAA